MKPEDKAVVQQALEFLEMISPQFPPLVYTETDRKRDEASTALRQLLEQQEPVAWHDKIMGMEVSMDVSTGDDDIDHRVYGTVYEVIFQDDGGTPDVILAIETERNFTTPPAQPAVQDKRLKVKLGSQYGHDLNGHWFYLQPADEFAEAALYKHTGVAAPQPSDHSEQHLDMVENGDLLTIVYMDGVHTGKRLVKREWVGLTYEEAKEIYTCIHGHDSEIRLCRAIEAKLREKNGGAV
jgi:hypothetical protein